MNGNKNLLPIILILIQSFLVIMISNYLFFTKDSIFFDVLLILIILIMVSFAITMIFTIKKKDKEQKRLIELNTLKAHLEQVESLVNLLQSQKHEHTRHVQTLQAMLHLDEVNEAKKYIDGIAESYWHMQDIINVGHPALTALLNTKQKVAESKGIDFAFSVKCEIAKIEVDSWDLSSIVGNLIDNAIEATLLQRDNRRVALEIKYEEERFRFYVINNGFRISELEKERLFQPGYTTKGSKARGYGLYLVKKILANYGGLIEVESREGKTTFVAQIPAKGVKRDV